MGVCRGVLPRFPEQAIFQCGQTRCQALATGTPSQVPLTSRYIVYYIGFFVTRNTCKGALFGRMNDKTRRIVLPIRRGNIVYGQCFYGFFHETVKRDV